MLAVENIIRIALRETDGPVPDTEAFTASVKRALEKPEQIPTFTRAARPLDVVRFRCLLQDTGYPAEVYLPEDQEGDKVDWSKLQERWVGWATEIPGEQEWAHLQPTSGEKDVADALAGLAVTELPAPVKGKFSLASQKEYTGALLKVYDAEAAYRPASAYDVIGIVSTAPLPKPLDEVEEGEAEMVPAIHVLLPPTPAFPTSPLPRDVPTTRAALISHLANAFSPPDAVAAELLLLAMIATPASRRAGIPLGTLSLNLVRPAGDSALVPLLESLLPAVVPLDMTLPLLHSTAFVPSSDGASLAPGLLQLAPGTLLVVNEDGLGNGGALAEKALRNVQALTTAIADQTVSYAYPYTDGVRIECALRSIITSEGKSLLPADLHIPVTPAAALPTDTDTATDDLAAFRAYLSAVAAPAHADTLVVPDAVGETIQDAFVADRKASGSGSADAAEARLRRRMKVARLMATSYPAAQLTNELWERTVALDNEVERRLAEREARRREGKIGAPTKEANGVEKAEGTVEKHEVAV